MKHKSLFGLLVVLVAVCVYLFHVIYSDAKQKAIDDLNVRQEIHARQARRGIEDFFDHTVEFLKKISESQHIAHFDDAGRREMDFAFKIDSGAITAMTRLDAWGKILCTTPYIEGSVGKDISGQPHVRKLMTERKTTVSDVFTSIQGYPAIALHVPVFADGNFAGSIGILIDFKSISRRFLEVIRLGNTGYAWMIGKDGVELYCPVPGHTGNSVFEKCKEYATILAMVEEMLEGRQGKTIYTFDMIRDQKTETIKKHAVYMPIRVADSYWSIVVASSEKEVLAGLKSFKDKLIFVFSLLAIGGAFFVYYGLKSWMIVREEVERKKSEESLRRSREMLARTEGIAHIGSWEWEIATDTVTWSDELFHIFGIDPGGKAPSWAEHDQLYHPEDMKRLRKAVESAVSDGAPFELELRVLRQDGTGRTCLAQGFAGRTDDGKVTRLFGTLRDVTEIKALEKSLDRERRQSEREKDLLLGRYKRKAIEMEAMFNGAELLLQDKDFETTSKEIVDMCRRLTGARRGFMPLASAHGMSGAILFPDTGGSPPDDSFGKTFSGEDLIARVQEAGRAFHENDFPRSPLSKSMPAGLGRIENALFAPVMDNEKTVGLIVLADKEGGFVESDSKIVSALGELAAVSWKQNATRQALHESAMRLRQIEKLESLGNLAGGIAHDINNILSAIIGYTQLALEDVGKGSLMESHLNEVHTAGMRATELVRQILTFARRVDTEFKPVKVSLIAKEVLKLLRSTIPADIAIQSEIQSESLVLGDVTQIHQVFLNLCTNAAQAMESEGGELRVRLRDVRLEKNVLNRHREMSIGPGDYLEITISDTGAGIAPEQVGRIFDPYFTTKELGRGTGMGLSTVHGIVKAYNGEIVVRSQLGEGSSFTIYLPATKRRSEADKYVAKELPGGRESVLVVDDEAPIANMTKMILRRLGYRVTTRTDSQEALELFREGPDRFDLAITDMAMPNMTGDKLARELKKIRPDLPVVLCTGYSNKVSGKTAEQLGVAALVMKPLGRAKLAETVRKALDDG